MCSLVKCILASFSTKIIQKCQHLFDQRIVLLDVCLSDYACKNKIPMYSPTSMDPFHPIHLLGNILRGCIKI